MGDAFLFAHISDTHVLPDETARNQVVADYLAEIAMGEFAFVIHTGDLMGEPSVRAARAFRAIASRLQIPFHVVPGNHDVYNPPLGEIEAPWWAKLEVDSEMEAQYRSWFGPTWYAFSYQGAHFLALDSLIINSGLPEEEAQWRWLEETLVDVAAGEPEYVFLFTHLPLFIRHPYEHLDATDFRNRYLVMAPPGRDRLLDLIRRYRITVVLGGHLHVPWEMSHTWPEGFTTRFVITGTSGCPSAMAIEQFDLPMSPAEGLGFHEHRVGKKGLSSRYRRYLSSPVVGRC